MHCARQSATSSEQGLDERFDDLELELLTFGLGGAAAYVRAAREARRRYRGTRFDVVHAHFGLTIWPSLAVHRMT